MSMKVDQLSKHPNLSSGFPENFKLKPIVGAVKDAVKEIGKNYIKEKEETVKRYLYVTNIINTIKNSSSLSDIFEVDKDGIIQVKNPGENKDESKLLSGHFPGMSVVPGVLLRQLYEEVSGVDFKKLQVRKTDFLKGVVPGKRLKIVNDGIVDEKGQHVLKYSVEKDISLFDDKNDLDNVPGVSIKNPENFVLHDGVMKLFDSVIVYNKKEGELNVGDNFKGQFILPETKELFDSNGIFNTTFLDEIAAQVASAGFSYVINKDLLDEYGEKAKEKDKFTLLTYKNNTSLQLQNPNLKPGDTVEIEVTVKYLSDKEVVATYMVMNGQDVLQIGEIAGGVNKRRVLRMCLK